MILSYDYFIQLMTGTLLTLKLATTSLVFGLIGGICLACAEAIPNIFVKKTVRSCIFLIRSTPELLVLFFIYFGVANLLQQIFHHYIDLNPMIAGIIALSIIFSAYASQVFRGAFLAIEQGQLDAAQALGLNRLQCFFHIQLPQAWRHAIPGIGNLWLVLLKDTTIVMLIGLSDLMGNAKIISSSTREPFNYFFIAALIYLLISTLSQFVIQILTNKANRYLYQHEHHELFA